MDTPNYAPFIGVASYNRARTVIRNAGAVLDDAKKFADFTGYNGTGDICEITAAMDFLADSFNWTYTTRVFAEMAAKALEPGLSASIGVDEFKAKIDRIVARAEAAKAAVAPTRYYKLHVLMPDPDKPADSDGLPELKTVDVIHSPDYGWESEMPGVSDEMREYEGFLLVPEVENGTGVENTVAIYVFDHLSGKPFPVTYCHDFEYAAMLIDLLMLQVAPTELPIQTDTAEEILADGIDRELQADSRKSSKSPRKALSSLFGKVKEVHNDNAEISITPEEFAKLRSIPEIRDTIKVGFQASMGVVMTDEELTEYLDKMATEIQKTGKLRSQRTDAYKLMPSEQSIQSLVDAGVARHVAERALVQMADGVQTFKKGVEVFERRFWEHRWPFSFAT